MRRRMAQLRRSACRCYQSEDFTFVIHKVEKEVECGLIAVRQEKHILADLGSTFILAFCTASAVSQIIYFIVF